MDLGKKIYELRKKNNITQEQLAMAVGVSTPAVCKWETGVSMPDISLLAPIARKLNTNMDDLLSFQEALSDAEIDDIFKEIKDITRREGLNAGIELSNRYLKQYPNVDELKLAIAMLPAIMAHTADDEYVKDEEKFSVLMDKSTRYLEELTHSGNDRVKVHAMISLATRYMESRHLDEAEALLKKIPGYEFDTRHIFPTLYLMKMEEDKAMQYSQSNMLTDVQNVLMDIHQQHSVYLKRQEYDKALKCAQDYRTMVQMVGVTVNCGSFLIVQAYLAMKDQENAAKYFLDFIEEIKNIRGDYQKQFYYSEISNQVVVASSNVEDDIRISLYKAVLLDERYQVLRKDRIIAKRLEELKAMIYK